jgi:hypothetical protein
VRFRACRASANSLCTEMGGEATPSLYVYVFVITDLTTAPHKATEEPMSKRPRPVVSQPMKASTAKRKGMKHTTVRTQVGTG